MKKPTKTKKLYLALPDDFVDRAMALQEQAPGGGCLWRERGAFVAEHINGLLGSKRMIVYQQAADIWAVGLSTVREDLRNAGDFGDFVDEMPFHVSREHCRCARTEGRIRDVDPLIVLQERANESDKHGSQLCPPRVWKAQIADLRNGKKNDDGEDVIGRIRAAGSCIATAMKRANGKQQFATLVADLEVAGAMLEDLLDKAESVK
jgi:hypothetical protein